MRSCFEAISGDRREFWAGGGMGPGRLVVRSIPYTAFAKWADDHGYYGAQREELEALTRAMDDAYIGWHNDPESIDTRDEEEL